MFLRSRSRCSVPATFCKVGRVDPDCRACAATRGIATDCRVRFEAWQSEAVAVTSVPPDMADLGADNGRVTLGEAVNAGSVQYRTWTQTYGVSPT